MQSSFSHDCHWHGSEISHAQPSSLSKFSLSPTFYSTTYLLFSWSYLVTPKELDTQNSQSWLLPHPALLHQKAPSLYQMNLLPSSLCTLLVSSQDDAAQPRSIGHRQASQASSMESTDAEMCLICNFHVQIVRRL